MRITDFERAYDAFWMRSTSRILCARGGAERGVTPRIGSLSSVRANTNDAKMAPSGCREKSGSVELELKLRFTALVRSDA
jgi:hypothetical protein